VIDDTEGLKKRLEQQNLLMVGLENERNQLKSAAIQAAYTPVAFLSDEVLLNTL